MNIDYSLPITQGESFRILTLHYFPFTPQEDVMLRPYSVNADRSALTRLTDEIIKNNGQKIDESLVAGVSTHLIMPTAQGWETPINQSFMRQDRYIFMLVAESRDFNGLLTKSYVHGYTDHDGISMAGVFPGMKHIVHSVIETVVSEEVPSLNRPRTERFSKIYELVPHNGGPLTFTQRPMDVLTTMKTNNYLDIISDTNSRHYGESQDASFNASNRLDSHINPIATSKIENNVVTSYITGVVNEGLSNFQSARHNFDTKSYTDMGSTTLIAHTREHDISDNRFLQFVSRVEGVNNIVSNEFSYHTLCQIDPSINKAGSHNEFVLWQTKYDPTDPLNHIPDRGEHWKGQDPVTPVAQHILSSALSLASRYGFQKFFFEVDNLNIQHQVVHGLGDYKSYVTLVDPNSGLNPYEYLVDRVLGRFIEEIYMPISYQSTVDLYVKIYIDTHGVSRIYIEYMGYPGTWHTLVTVTSGHAAPTLTVDINTVNFTSNAIRSLIDDVNANVKKNPLNNFPDFGI